MKNLFGFLGVILALLAVSCGTVKMIENVPPYVYTGDNPIYPAVFYAVVNAVDSGSEYTSNFRDSKPFIINPNTIELRDLTVSDGLKLAQFTLRISLENSVVTYQFKDIRTRAIGENSYTPVARFSQPSREAIFTDFFNREIPKVMEDEELYADLKREIDGNLGL